MFFSLDAYRPEQVFELGDGTVAGDGGISIGAARKFEQVDKAPVNVRLIVHQLRKLFREFNDGEYQETNILYRKTEKGFSFQLFIMQDNKRKVYEISTFADGKFNGTFTRIDL